MQRKQGYCSYCRVQYPNLEQHLFSAQHRSLTRQSRRRICTSSLMERFLQDVLRHHPYNYQENRASQNEMSMNAASPEVVHLEDFFSEEYVEDTPETIGETLSESSESVEELTSEPSDQSQEPVKEIAVRPSVIQKLEKGQQQSLEFVHKIESGMKKINPVDIGQATSSGKNPVRPPVICNAPASCLTERSYDRPVATTTARLPLAVHLDSVSRYDTNKVHKHLEQLDMFSRNPVPSAHVETSVSNKNPKESNRKSLSVNSDKLVLQKDVRSQGELSPGFKFCELKGTENSVRVKSSFRVAVNSAVNLNKTDKPSDKGIFEDAIPKHHEELLSNMDCSQEEEHLVFKKSSFLKQKFSVSSEAKFDCGPLQSASDQSQEAVQDLSLWKEEQVDQEDENYESRGSEMSFDCGSSCHSLTDQSEMSDREINLSEETHADLPHKNKKSCVSEKSSDRNDSLQAVTKQSQVFVKEGGLQKTARISLVDESYETSGSEMNSDCDEDLPQSAKKYRQQPVKEVDLPHISLVDRDYGWTSSESSADSIFSLESVVNESSVVVTEKQVWKKAHIRLVDASYGSSCSESSFDCDTSPHSVVDQPQVTVKGKKPKHRHVHLKNKKRKPSRAKAHLDCDVSLETVADEPQRAVEGKYLLKAKNADLVDMNCESHGPEMGFHADAQLVADQSQVAVKEVNPQKVDNDLENKSIQASISYLSFDSHAFLYQSANDQPQGALGEVNLKELNVDMEVKSYGCSSSELTFDSDSPLLSVTERSQLDVERIKEDHINLEDESCESNSSDITFDSDIPDCSVVDQPEVAVGEEEPVDLENKSNESCISEITFDSDIPLHSGIDHPEVAVKEVIIQEEEYVHLERKNDKPNDSEINLDSYAPLHSVTNPPEVADKKLSPQKEEQVLFKNKENEPADSELNFAYNTIFPSMTGHSEDSFKDIDFQKEEHIHFENQINELSVSKTRLDSDIPLHSVIHKPEVVVKNIWLQKEKYAEFQGKNVELSCSEINSDSDIPHPVAEPHIAVKRKEKRKHIIEAKMIRQTTVRKGVLKSRRRDQESTSCKSCSEMGFQCDPSHHSDTNQPRDAVKKRSVKRVTFDLGEKSRDSQSDSAPMVDSGKNLEKDKVVMDDPDEPVIEASPHVPPSFVGKTWSQIIRENDSKINALVKEFKEGRFRCYFNDESKIKNIALNKEKQTTWPVFNQATASVQTVSNHDDFAGGISADVDNCAVAVEKPCCYYALAERFLSKQSWHVASQSQTEKVSHGTQTSFVTYPLKKRKIVRQEEDSPKKKCLQTDRKEKKNVQIGTVELPASQTKVLESVHLKPVVRVLSSLNVKPKEGESCSSPKVNHCACDNDLQFLCKYKQGNRNCPSLLKIVNTLPPNLVISESDMCKCNIHLHESDLNSSAGENDAVQNLASTSHMIIPARYELRSRRGTSESSTFLENSEVVNASEVPEGGNFQLTLLSHGVAKISPKLVRNEFFESKSKKKIQRRNVMTTSKNPSFPKKLFKAIILRQKARIASEKWSVWIRTKVNDIIRKYISKYSAFLRHRYQSRTTFFGIHLKKKTSGASRLEEVEKSTQTLLDTSVPPAGAKEKLRAIVSPLKQPVQHASRAVGRKKPKKSHRRKKKRPIPVREYDLRSSCYIPDSDRMMTRLSSKLKSNEVK
ncbi:DBF4-type zinc finger-containing protein 2 [Sciurus carolinensis]|uniref:DBF4-type zinc finger-containing protein 2 n=1 Tax=Sciurus carolinensis TaxID=30640 RepID=A0AA41NG90_SCICA|nr:DBF4-type zinc finger-containing protein 2 [Sciurus carolinensis]